MKTFYSAQDIEDLARQGTRELAVDDSVVLTDLARQAAALLGVKLVPGGRPAEGAGLNPSPAPRNSSDGAARGASAMSPSAPLPARPRGCQHGPVGDNGTPAGQAGVPNGASGGKVVDDLVGLVKQMNKR